MPAEWLSRYVSIEKESTYGTEPSGTQIYGEVDDESFKQTFELLTRTDMARQVASKATTNTKYGEGTINFAVQPDDFMGSIVAAFLPVNVFAHFIDGLDLSNATKAGSSLGEQTGSITFANNASGNTNATVAPAGFYRVYSAAEVGSSGQFANMGLTAGQVYAYITNPGEYPNSTDAPTATLVGLSHSGNGGSGTQPSPNNPAVTFGGGDAHVFNEPTTDSHAYPSFTIRIGREDKEHTFTGMAATRLALTANLNEYVMASADFIGQKELAPAAIQTSGLNFSSADAMHFSKAELYVDGSVSKTTKIRSISLEININRDLDSAYAVGQNTLTRMPPSRTREITGTMEFNEIIYDDTTGVKGEPTYQDLADTAASGTVHKIQTGSGIAALKFQFVGDESGDQIEIELYNVRFEAPEAAVSGRDPARMSVGFQAFFDNGPSSTVSGAGKAIQIKMRGSGLKHSKYV